MIKPIIGRVGGKWRISKWVLEHIKRFEWSLYCEPFCGSAAIYFQLLNDGIPELIRSRGHHPRFVLNDMDSKIINLYRCCRDFPELLAYAVYHTPYSREEHREAQKGEAVDDLIEMCNRYLVDGWQHAGSDTKIWGTRTWTDRLRGRNDKTTPVIFNSMPDRILTASQHLGERFQELKQGIESIPDIETRKKSEQALDAILKEVQKTLETDLRVEFVRRFLVDGWQSFTAEIGNSWVADKIQDRKQSGKVLTKEFSCLSTKLLTASPHLQEISELKKVYLENDDFEKVCRRWDTKHTLHFCDSPYIGKEDYYSEKFTLDDHYRLAQMANELEGQVILSYYPDSLLDKLYPEQDWDRFYKETVASSAGVTKNSKTKTRPRRTEMLLVRKNRNPEKILINIGGQMSLL